VVAPSKLHPSAGSPGWLVGGLPTQKRAIHLDSVELDVERTRIRPVPRHTAHRGHCRTENDVLRGLKRIFAIYAKPCGIQRCCNESEMQ
jgi:hypothetical protein